MERIIEQFPQSALRDSAVVSYSALTRREREVLTLIAAGQTNREMAESLVVSPETVKTHVRHVLSKFGVSRKAEIYALIDREQ
ncbi:MAG: helix-turn-helix transcriptional regulator [Anaerolineales bacterium]|nr:helix-turn-helix transcriptional regulator [Anaerolineales bacterium]